MDKRISMAILGFMAVTIILSGASYSIYSAICKTSFHVLNTDIPGYIMGFVAIFLGARYIKAVAAFSKKIGSFDSRFSWSNFKRVRNSN